MPNQACKIKFKVGDIVFSKMRFFPIWPSIIREIDCTKVKVEFICPEKTWAWINITKVQLFSDELVKVMRKKNAGNIKLQCSINESLIYIEEIKKKVQNRIQMISKNEPCATSTVSSVQKFEESQTTVKQNGDRRMAAEMEHKQSKTEMDEDEKIRKLRESFEAMENTVTIDRNIDLKDMNIDETIKTFPKHEAILRDFFRSKQRIPDCRFIPAHGETQFLLILDELLLEPQKKEMYLKIRSEFDEPKIVDAITSNHENLFWKGILPEWALQIFMDKFSLDRADAIKQLTDQACVKHAQKYPFDLSF